MNDIYSHYTNDELERLARNVAQTPLEKELALRLTRLLNQYAPAPLSQGRHVRGARPPRCPCGCDDGEGA